MEYTNISFGGDTRARIHCEPNDRVDHPIFGHHESNGIKNTNKTDWLTNVTINELSAIVPTGDSDKLIQIQVQTIGLTILGMSALLYEIFRKSGERVKAYS